jgi:hypothetical protein
MRRDPFAALGLAASSELTDDDVRAAWRRLAAATHPDRADGGDPAAFALAAGAYSELRTRLGRTEALADLRTTPRRRRPARRWTGQWTGQLRPARPARPTRLALRLAAATGASVLVVVIGGWQPATFALIVGALTWLIRTSRHDLAPHHPATPPASRVTDPRPAERPAAVRNRMGGPLVRLEQHQRTTHDADRHPDPRPAP